MYCFLQLSHLSQEGMSQFTDEAEADVTQLVGGALRLKLYLQTGNPELCSVHHHSLNLFDPGSLFKNTMQLSMEHHQ